MLSARSLLGLCVALLLIASAAGCSRSANDDAVSTETPDSSPAIERPERRTPDESTDALTPATAAATSTTNGYAPEVGATTVLADGRSISIDKPAEPSARPSAAAARWELNQPAPSPPGTDSGIAPAVVPPGSVTTDGDSAGGDSTTSEPAIGTSRLVVLGQVADTASDNTAPTTSVAAAAESVADTASVVTAPTTTSSTSLPPTTSTTLAPAPAPNSTSPAASGDADQLIVEWDDRGAPIAATTAEGLGRQIILAESAIGVGADLAAMAHLQQLAYRTLSERPEWEATVLAMVPRRHLAVVQAHLAARQSFLAHATRPDSLPSWTIVEPTPLDELRAHYDEAESIFGVPASQLAALHLVSSGFGRIRVADENGPQGPLQFLPETWEQWGQGDPNNARHAILAAARLLRGKGWDTDPTAAMFSFNDNPTYVEGVETYAALIEEHPEQLAALHAWQIYYLASSGDVWLAPTPISAP